MLYFTVFLMLYGFFENIKLYTYCNANYIFAHFEKIIEKSQLNTRRTAFKPQFNEAPTIIYYLI